MRKLLTWLRGARTKSGTPTNDNGAEHMAPPASSHSAYDTKPITGIEWVDNDGLLRDEGVLFGIADADYALKIESIKSAFDKVKASFLTTKYQLQETLKSIEGEEDKSLDSITETKQALEAIRSNAVKTTHSSIPGLFQLLVYGSICYFNYFLLVYWLRPVFPDQPFIPLGLYLFGLLSVFMGKALVYNSNASTQATENHPEPKREKWKIILEEMGIPFIVSLFTCTLGFRSYPIEWSIAAFALFFFLFSFSGKGLINIIHINYRHLKLQLKHWKTSIGKRKEIKKQFRLLAQLEKKKEQLFADIKAPETNILELDALFSYKVKVFESEYHLAREARSELSVTQVRSF